MFGILRMPSCCGKNALPELIPTDIKLFVQVAYKQIWVIHTFVSCLLGETSPIKQWSPHRFHTEKGNLPREGSRVSEWCEVPSLAVLAGGQTGGCSGSIIQWRGNPAGLSAWPKVEPGSSIGQLGLWVFIAHQGEGHTLPGVQMESLFKCPDVVWGIPGPF